MEREQWRRNDTRCQGDRSGRGNNNLIFSYRPFQISTWAPPKELRLRLYLQPLQPPATERVVSDNRPEEVRHLDDAIGDGVMLHPQQLLQQIHTLIRLLEAEQISDARLPRAYYDAFQTVIAHGDQMRAKIFAERAYAARLGCEGDDSLLRLSEVLVSFSQRLGDCLEERMGLGTSSVTSEMVLCLMTGECSRFSIPLSLTTKQCRTMSKLWLRKGIWYVRTWHFLYSLQLRLGQ